MEVFQFDPFDEIGIQQQVDQEFKSACEQIPI